MALYIDLLWPSEEDAKRLEAYRRAICQGCDVGQSLTWPVHQTLLYGIASDAPESLASALNEARPYCEALSAKTVRPDVFSDHTVYLRVKPDEQTLRLQRLVKDAVLKAGAHLPGWPPLPKPDGAPLSENERANILQWGSYHPFEPHITLVRNLDKERCASVMRRANGLAHLLPKTIQMDRLSIETLNTSTAVESGVVAEIVLGACV